MLSFVTLVGATAADPLTDASSADAFWRMLPRNDPIAAQEAVSGALADLIARGRPGIGRLRALLALDQRARSLIDRLLVNYVAGKPQPPSLERQYWQSAFELCGSFGEAHDYFLRSMRDSLLFQGWREYLPSVALRLFQHRQIELLLRPFVDELSTRTHWKKLHEAYQFAHSRGLLRKPLPASRCHSQRTVDTTLEREYIHLLLQDLMNGGQFPPHDAFWANQCIPRWCNSLALELHQVRAAEHRFVVDLDGDAGLTRSSHGSTDKCLYLDTVPVLESIRDAIASLRDAPGPAGAGSSLGRGRQLKLLRRLNALLAPKPPVIARRGERKPVALAVEVVAGRSQIIRALRNKPKTLVVAAPASVPEVEEITITAIGGFTEDPAGGFADGACTVSPKLASPAEAAHLSMKLVDRSDSGCRLHGQMSGTNRVTPGTLIAFREDAASPWTLAVIRRVQRLAGKRVDIGVEYVGKDPRGVIVTVVSDADAAPDRTPDIEPPRFAAIYLPESAKHPVLPIKTMVLPARKFAPEDRLTLQSATAVYAIQLKVPLEEQGDFIWTPFEIVDHRPSDPSVHVESTSVAP